MQATYEEVYREEKNDWEDGTLRQCVLVSLRHWSCAEGIDWVLERFMKVDGQVTLHEAIAILAQERHTMIRYAISEFDRLVKEHPVFGGG